MLVRVSRIMGSNGRVFCGKHGLYGSSSPFRFQPEALPISAQRWLDSTLAEASTLVRHAVLREAPLFGGKVCSCVTTSQLTEVDKVSPNRPRPRPESRQQGTMRI